MKKTYVVTDIHGNYKLWSMISDYCDKDDTIYFLGDACDRGPDGIKIIQELLVDPRVKYIRGNHEELLIKCAFDKITCGKPNPNDLYLFYTNGGEKTWDDFQKLTEKEQIGLLRKLRNLPYHLTYTNTKGQEIFLCHAGCDLDQITFDENEFIWDREHLLTEWIEELDSITYKDKYVVHGHTPVQSMVRKFLTFRIEVPEEAKSGYPAPYFNGHKINLDLGTFVSNRIALFDLDELKVAKMFYDLEEEVAE